MLYRTLCVGPPAASMMLMPWLLLLVCFTTGQIVHEGTEDTLNTTTLYPTNKTIDMYISHKNHTGDQLDNTKTIVIKENNNKNNANEEDKVEVTTPKKEKITKWTIDANYAQPEEKQSQEVYVPPEAKSHAINTQPKDKERSSICIHSDHEQTDDSNSSDSKEQLTVERPKNNSEEKKFKPSPHLGSFFDEENLNLLKFSTRDQSLYNENKPAVDFFGSKDFYMLNYKSPKDTYQDQLEAPYRFETSHFLTANNWKQTLESKPTVESSVKIPAGDLYRHPISFKDKPSSHTDHDDFGLGFHEDEREKQTPVKKRSNPWKQLVQLMTAFLPVGLIISALTPSIVTLHTTDNDPYLVRGRASRRVGIGGVASVPAISEPCRRRLLCEIHAEENYLRSQDMPRHARKHCYKLQCEDPASLRRVLRWLLGHRPAPSPAHYTGAINPHRRDDHY